MAHTLLLGGLISWGLTFRGELCVSEWGTYIRRRELIFWGAYIQDFKYVKKDGPQSDKPHTDHLNQLGKARVQSKSKLFKSTLGSEINSVAFPVMLCCPNCPLIHCMSKSLISFHICADSLEVVLWRLFFLFRTTLFAATCVLI